MKGSIKIIGTNSITKHFQNQIFEKCTLQSEGKVHSLFLNGNKHFLDIKESHFNHNFVLIFGIISDDTKFVGNIALEFYPEKTANSNSLAEKNLDFVD
jgi:hypothetical protein